MVTLEIAGRLEHPACRPDRFNLFGLCPCGGACSSWLDVLTSRRRVDVTAWACHSSAQ